MHGRPQDLVEQVNSRNMPRNVVIDISFNIPNNERRTYKNFQLMQLAAGEEASRVLRSILTNEALRLQLVRQPVAKQQDERVESG